MTMCWADVPLNTRLVSGLVIVQSIEIVEEPPYSTSRNVSLGTGLSCTL
jgi:hypothetical protein